MTNDEREHWESFLAWPGGPPSLDPAKITTGDWNEAVELDAICRRAEAALRVRAEYKQAEEHSVQVVWSEKFIVTGMRISRSSILRVGLANPRRWASCVADRRMEVIGGRLVLLVLNEFDDRERTEAEVLMVEQGRGMSVVPAIGKVVKAESGKWRIHAKPDKRHPALEVLCRSVPRGKEPDDRIWKAAQFVRMVDASRSFEQFAKSRLTIDAEGGTEIN